jgi:antitoxin (DNA-binding transcriptional repressor) of toxin-antitoxin stability system
MAEARERFKELLDRAEAGEIIEIARRGQVAAVIGPPEGSTRTRDFGAALASWRERWDTAAEADDDVFGDVRDTSPGRPLPW